MCRSYEKEIVPLISSQVKIVKGQGSEKAKIKRQNIVFVFIKMFGPTFLISASLKLIQDLLGFTLPKIQR